MASSRHWLKSISPTRF